MDKNKGKIFLKGVATKEARRGLNRRKRRGRIGKRVVTTLIIAMIAVFLIVVGNDKVREVVTDVTGIDIGELIE